MAEDMTITEYDMEPEILQREVRWATNRMFQGAKRQCNQGIDNVMPTNIENTAMVLGLEKSIFIPIPKNGNAKDCSNYRTIAFISHARHTSRLPHRKRDTRFKLPIYN